MLGLALQVFSGLLLIGALLAALFLYTMLKHPEIGLVGILVATSSIVFESQLPAVSLGGISLHIPDLMLLGLLGLIAIRRIFRPDFRLARTPINKPLIAFLVINFISALAAISRSSVGFVDARRMIRILSYYLIFFIVVNLVKETRQLSFLVNSLFLLATVIALAMILQFFLGHSIQLLPGRVESLRTQTTLYGDITRILPPGVSILLISFCALFCNLICEKNKTRKFFRLIQFSLIGIALIFTFLRSYWAALIMLISLLLIAFRGSERRKLIAWILIGFLSAGVFLIVVFCDPSSRIARFTNAYLERMGTLFRGRTFQGGDDSLTWRKIENKYAISAIASHPLFGQGAGAIYRPLDSRLDRLDTTREDFDFRKYIHNSHLGIILQSGLIGYSCLVWLSAVFLIRSLRLWRTVANCQLRSVVLGFSLCYVAIILSALVVPTFMQWNWVPVIGTIMGINEAVLKKKGDEKEELKFGISKI